MNLGIRKIADAGNLDRERVVIDVLVDADLGSFILAAGTRIKSQPREISSRIWNLLWFPDLFAEEGDTIFVYTRGGGEPYVEGAMRNGGVAHKFYLNREAPLWDHPRRIPVLLELADWDFGRGIA